MTYTTVRRQTTTICLAGILAVAGACSQQEEGPGAASRSTEVAAARPITMADLRSATYHGVHSESVALVAGRWEGEPYTPDAAARPRLLLVDDFVHRGDLDGDGVAETVVVLSTTTGGSGEFLFLAVMGRQGDDTVNLATADVGDRVKLRSGAVADGEIVLQVVQPGASDAACCPGDLATRSWVFGDHALTELPAKITGRLSVETLKGTAWLLERLGSSEAAPEYPQITLFFDGGQAVGSSGCNRYFGKARDGGVPGSLKVGPFGATMMACPDPMMELEQKYMGQLASAKSFSFVGGKLAITWKNSGVTDVMLFSGHELAEE